LSFVLLLWFILSIPPAAVLGIVFQSPFVSTAVA
jgi:hypothetical protein